MNKSVLAMLFTGIIIIFIGCGQSPVQTYESALAESALTGKPVLIDFFAEWCGPCQRFQTDSHEDMEVMAELENVILLKIDSEKGDGIELAKKYGVLGYPTYALINSDEQPIDRWMGYGKDMFIEMMNKATSDLSTIDEKLQRMSASPSIKDALVLGRYYQNSGEYNKAYEFHTNAQQLNTDSETHYFDKIFESAADGYFRDQISYSDVATAAENLIGNGSNLDIALACSQLSRIAGKEDDTETVKKYFEIGLKASEDNNDEQLRKIHTRLQVDYNLQVIADTAKAVEFKKASMRDNWTESAGGLNAFTWWCYENNANLGEANILARKAVEMAEPGSQKAMILDTAAHICKARGNYEDAIKFMEQAMIEDPENKQWNETLEKFKNEMQGL